MGLAKESCTPCRTGEGKLTGDEVAALLGKLSGWSVDGEFIYKQWKFKNFVAALAFVTTVGEIAEAQFHHPDIVFGWGYAEIRLTTHKAQGVTRNDFILAARIDAAVG
ncbi:MAG: 4a-hydroxytetrahydrobiopterin dehydratase [Pseudomonadota bacterium]